jgi:hypothetical protein
MNDNDGIIITETTSEDRRTFRFQHRKNKQQSKSSQKGEYPKLKGILKNHRTTIPMVSPFDPWCDGEEFDEIDREDVLDTVQNRFVPHIVN